MAAGNNGDWATTAQRDSDVERRKWVKGKLEVTDKQQEEERKRSEQYTDWCTGIQKFRGPESHNVS